MKKRLGLILIFAILVFLVTTCLALHFVASQTSRSSKYFLKTAYSAFTKNSYQNQSKVQFLVLGLDNRDDSLEKTITTDTVMLVSINQSQSNIKIVSVPRDLWVYDLKIKINGIYPLSLEQPAPFTYLKANFEKIFDQKIDSVIVITTDNLIDFVKIIGGVDVYLDKGFKDEQYPNPEYIKSPSSQIPIYATIEFPSGINHLNADNITQFVRSRKSSEDPAEGGTDLGRIQRQQILIEAILAKVKQKEFFQNYRNLITLYNFWNQKLTTNLTDVDLLSLGINLKDKLPHLTFQRFSPPVGKTAKDGVIYHPLVFPNRQWVFLPVGPDYQKLKTFIKDSLD
ncbi:MAG: LCP family protein [Candidatus Shapirobacteria bacterium]